MSIISITTNKRRFGIWYLSYHRVHHFFRHIPILRTDECPTNNNIKDSHMLNKLMLFFCWKHTDICRRNYERHITKTSFVFRIIFHKNVYELYNNLVRVLFSSVFFFLFFFWKLKETGCFYSRFADVQVQVKYSLIKVLEYLPRYSTVGQRDPSKYYTKRRKEFDRTNLDPTPLRPKWENPVRTPHIGFNWNSDR